MRHRNDGSAMWWLAMFVSLVWVAATSVAQAADPAAGLYMSRLADCQACHTQPGGTPFAGGREIGTPYGTLSSPNITPDRDTGIGAMTDDQFYAALHDGISRHGQYLYPVMPFTSYTKMTRDDVLAVKTYLFTLKPVYAPRAPSGMEFPFNIRASLFFWRELFFRAATYQDRPAHTAEWNRGAYIVQGPGHCGECHSPRNILGATESGDSLAGGQVQQWLAPNISSDPLDGIGAKSVDQIVTFLRGGANHAMGVAYGPMAEVVHDSLRYTTDADIHAVAVFLKTGPDRAGPVTTNVATAADRRAGQTLYLANCAQCHQDQGSGIPGVIPNLAGNAALAMDRPTDLIVAILQGLQGRAVQMPGFAGALTDQNIADIGNYIRTAWGDRAPANLTPAMVASVRAQSIVGAGGSEAARDFDCPKVGGATVPGALATGADTNFLSSDDGAYLNQRLGELVSDLRNGQPGISDARVANTMMAAMCPAVAGRGNLSTAEKRALLFRLNSQVLRQIAATSTPPGSHVVTTVTLSPEVTRQINNEAAARHETPAAYLSDVIGPKPRIK